MVGIWDPVGTSFNIEITADGNQTTIQPPVPYNFMGGGTGLDWDGWRFIRKLGDGETLVGVWETDDVYMEEYHFRPDGTFTYHDPFAPTDLFGTYQVEAGPEKLGTKEFRGVITVTGNELDHDPVFYPSDHYEWEITADGLTMTWTNTSTSVTTVFTKVT